MPRKPKYRRPYPPEFRREAVALYARTDRTLGEIAGDLGVSRESLRLWVQQAQIERGERDGLTGDEREELRELRRRVLLLEQEREILKKAAAFFVRESETRRACFGSSRRRRPTIRSRCCAGCLVSPARASTPGSGGRRQIGRSPTRGWLSGSRVSTARAAAPTAPAASMPLFSTRASASAGSVSSD